MDTGLSQFSAGEVTSKVRPPVSGNGRLGNGSWANCTTKNNEQIKKKCQIKLFFKPLKSIGVPGRLNQVSIQLLIFTQVMISWSMRLSLHRPALC